MKLRRLAATLLVAAASALTACADTPIASPDSVLLPPSARLTVGPVTAVLTPGLEQQLLAVVADGRGEPLEVPVRWSVSDPAIATITSDGVVTARRLGTTLATASVGGLSASLPVTVQSAPVVTRELLLHRDIVATVFWVGEGADPTNNYISNRASAFDRSWLAHYGGIDAPSPRRGYFPAGFTPLENPFYFALPYSDLTDDGAPRANAAQVVPWAGERTWTAAESMVKNRWIRVTSPRTGRTCYAQWEDVGPGLTDDFAYVFGPYAPGNPFRLAGLSYATALDLSPAVRDCLATAQDVMRVDWQFVPAAEVPSGPWTEIVTTRQVSR